MAEETRLQLDVNDVMAEYGAINTDLASKLAVERATSKRYLAIITSQAARIVQLEAAAPAPLPLSDAGDDED